MAFLPQLAKQLLGQELRLPSVATWWCGQPAELDYVLKNLSYLVLRPINWESPAHILEKIIAYEAVHAIDSWNDREDGLTEIRAVVLVERESQKPIVIGNRSQASGSLAGTRW